MSKKNPFPELEGIIYAKPVKKVMGKKGENKGKELEIPSLVLEFTQGNSQKSQLLSFNIARSVPIDDFCVKDPVIVTFAMESIPWKDDYITKARAIYIKHADVDYNDTTNVNPKEFRKPKEEVFTGASPNDEPEEESDLPF